MATTLRDFGLTPEEPQSTPPRRRRYVIDDESGARPLPRDEYQARYEYVDPLDEDVELPGVSRERAGLLFGIGVGLGVAVLAVVGGLYLGGYVGRPALGPTPAVSMSLPGDPQKPFEEAQAIEALALARIAPVWIDERSAQVASMPTQVESPDIQVIDEASRAQPADATPAPKRASGAAQSGEELDAENPYSERLSNELDELQQSLRPRGPAAPSKEPTTSAPTMPEEPALPPPAAPTAPAETIPPAGSNQNP
jgi:hypothetical protein